MAPGATPAAGLPIGRIRARRDFLAANSGVRVPTASFILLVKPRADGAPRAGFTVSRKVGNAVVRNRARRRLREVARLAMADSAIPAADHVFIARPEARERPFADLLADTRRALARAAERLATG
ncbi:MAG: ribonuclease P protein component [Sphingomonadaceae bacterium]